jgi:hypothetical protein
MAAVAGAAVMRAWQEREVVWAHETLHSALPAHPPTRLCPLLEF